MKVEAMADKFSKPSSSALTSPPAIDVEHTVSGSDHHKRSLPPVMFTRSHELSCAVLEEGLYMPQGRCCRGGEGDIKPDRSCIHSYRGCGTTFLGLGTPKCLGLLERVLEWFT